MLCSQWCMREQLLAWPQNKQPVKLCCVWTRGCIPRLQSSPDASPELYLLPPPVCHWLLHLLEFLILLTGNPLLAVTQHRCLLFWSPPPFSTLAFHPKMLTTVSVSPFLQLMTKTARSTQLSPPSDCYQVGDMLSQVRLKMTSQLSKISYYICWDYTS